MTSPVLLDGPALARGSLRRWWLVVILVVIGGGLGYGWAKHQPTLYAANQEFVVSGQVLNPLLVSEQQVNLDPQRLVTTQTDLLTSQSVHDVVEQKLGHPIPRVSASGDASSNLVTATVKDGTTAGAESLLNQYLTAYRNLLSQQTAALYTKAEASLQQRINGYTQQLAVTSNAAIQQSILANRSSAQQLLDQAQAAQQVGPVDISLVGSPIASSVPVSPKPKQSAILGAALGLVLAVLLGAALESRTIRHAARHAAAFPPSVTRINGTLERGPSYNPALTQDGSDVSQLRGRQGSTSTGGG